MISINSLNCAQPLPSHVGEGLGVGVSNVLSARKLQTPPLPLPLRGGERLRVVSSIYRTYLFNF